MAALKKTVESPAGSRPQSKSSTRRIELATSECEPVESAQHQLRLHLEAAFAASPDNASLPEPDVEKWSRPVRAALLAGAALLPWSLIALTVHAVVARRLLP
jgi:hypothetical protein